MVPVHDVDGRQHLAAAIELHQRLLNDYNHGLAYPVAPHPLQQQQPSLSKCARPQMTLFRWGGIGVGVGGVGGSSSSGGGISAGGSGGGMETFTSGGIGFGVSGGRRRKSREPSLVTQESASSSSSSSSSSRKWWQFLSRGKRGASTPPRYCEEEPTVLKSAADRTSLASASIRSFSDRSSAWQAPVVSEITKAPPVNVKTLEHEKQQLLEETVLWNRIWGLLMFEPNQFIGKS